MAWLRLDEHIPENRKAQSLPAELFKFWINALCVAKKTEGRLTDLEDACFRLRLPETRLVMNLERLQTAKLVDIVDGVYCFHDWDAWQYKSDSSTTRMQSYRRRKKTNGETSRDASPTVTCDVTRDVSALSSVNSVNSDVLKLQEKNTALAPKEAPVGEWKNTALAMRSFFPTLDDEFIIDVCFLCIRVNNAVTDEQIAEAVYATYTISQRSPGLFKTTIPNYIRARKNGEALRPRNSLDVERERFLNGTAAAKASA